MEKTKLIEIEVTETKIGEFFYRVSEEEYRQIMEEGKELFEVITDDKRMDDLDDKAKEAFEDYDSFFEQVWKVKRHGER